MRFKLQRFGISFPQRRVDFVPGYRCGNSWSVLSSERIDADRRLMLIVLAPINEHFPNPELLLHFGHNFLRMLAFQTLSECLSKGLRLTVAGRAIQRHVEL